jgi:methyl-accepting chemotaxis protein
VEQQGAATREIARNVEMASDGAARVGSAITDVHQGAADTGSASGQVLSSAQSLSSQANQLKLEVDSFLASIRAA